MKLCPVILAGGAGMRLWPLSREHYPKQFLPLFGENSLLQNTLLRLAKLTIDQDRPKPTIICNEEHRFLVAQQCTQLKQNVDSIILEPKGRNTAPALTISAFNIIQQHDDPVIIMMPADHLIRDLNLFHKAIQVAYQMAVKDHLVTFGIKPTRAESGYGYLHVGKRIQNFENAPVHYLNGFTEKPDQATAEAYQASGDYLWNSGIFILKARTWLEKIKLFQSEIYVACEAAYTNGKVDGLFYRLDETAFLNSPSDSIDYAVMEKLAAINDEKLAVIPIDVGWSDVGSWGAVWELNKKDSNGNSIEGDVITDSTTNCFIKGKRSLIATIGCNEMVIVESDDAIMIADKNRTQDIKKIVEVLKNKNRNECLMHRKVYRPWGSYDAIESDQGFQVKRLTVAPKMKLSLQLHHKRAEHWVVVKGIATVTRGDDVFQLNENESTFIPIGVKHRLENKSNTRLEIIEIQSGSYLGEDDIVRFDDDFGRACEDTHLNPSND